jgi:hypothetical protein
MTKECTDATEAFYHTWVPSSTHVITFGCQLTTLQKKCRRINVIISDKAKARPFVGQMYKGDYFTEDQMTNYKMLSDADKEWDPTLDHFSKLFAQRKEYGDNRAANSRFESANTMFNIPSGRTFVMSKSNDNFTAHDLYIKSLEESLALAPDYMINAPTTAPTSTPVVNPLTTLHLEMDAQCKQFKLLLKQNLDLVAAFAKTNASPNPGSGATPKPRHTSCERSRSHLKECPNCKKMCTHTPYDCYSLAANADKCPTNYRAPLST